MYGVQESLKLGTYSASSFRLASLVPSPTFRVCLSHALALCLLELGHSSRSVSVLGDEYEYGKAKIGRSMRQGGVMRRDASEPRQVGGGQSRVRRPPTRHQEARRQEAQKAPSESLAACASCVDTDMSCANRSFRQRECTCACLCAFACVCVLVGLACVLACDSGACVCV